jgi:hypothetical protein
MVGKVREEGHTALADQSIGPSIGAAARPSLGKKETAMYTDGFGVAVVVAILALLSPVLWIGWWLLADVGERTNGTYPTRHREGAESKPVTNREEQPAIVGMPLATT